jgi:nucleotide-binding universal stress UspA family protein
MIEIKNVLCPVDLSEFSRHALEHAVALATWYDAHLTVLHVSGPSQLPVPLVGVAADVPVVATVQRDDAADEVRQFCSPLLTAGNIHPAIVVREGSPAKEIILEAERADLLVMGTHGRSGFERLFLGSVTEKVLRTTQVPVLTVPPPVERPESLIYKTIVCPVEFSDASTRALAYALSLAEETDAHLIVLHVVEGSVKEPPFGESIGHLNVREYYRYLEEDAMARLKAAVPEEARVWCKPDERVTVGKAYHEILKVTADSHAELIVMGVHGRGALHRRLFGSTTHHVVHEAGCPVLTLRA